MSSPSQGSGQATHSRGEKKKKKNSNMERKDDLVGFRAEMITSGDDFSEEKWGIVELRDPK